jgi:DNA polymerase-3 subunit epsilon
MKLLLKIKRNLLLRRYKDLPAFGRFFKETDLNRSIEESTFVVFDTETSGLNPNRAILLSIGAVKVKRLSLELSECFNVLLTPEGDIDASSIEVHGLRPKELMEKGSPPEQALEDFLEYIRGRILVGFYTRFDLRVVSRYTERLFGIPLLNY